AASPAAATPAAAQTTAPQSGGRTPGLGSATRPPVPAGISEMFLPNNLTLAEAYRAAGKTAQPGAQNLGLIYYPTILAQARIRFLNRKYGLDHEQTVTSLVYAPDRRGVVRWENFPAQPVDPARLEDQPAADGRFMPVEAPFNDAKIIKGLEKDFLDWVFRGAKVTVRSHEALKLYAGPQVSAGEFRQQCADAARAARDAEYKKATAALDRQIRSLEDKLAREQRELDEDQAELSNRKVEELGTHAENIFGLFTGRAPTRRVSSSLSKRRQTAQAKAEVAKSQQAIVEYKKQLAELDKEKARLESEINNRWGELANKIDEVTVTPLKKDVLVDVYGVAWLPCYIIQADGQTEALRAYAAEG
ncbi:MAG: hypothetical protein ACKOC5_04925, partial [Chloroflexota bacterium]